MERGRGFPISGLRRSFDTVAQISIEWSIDRCDFYGKIFGWLVESFFWVHLEELQGVYIILLPTIHIEASNNHWRHQETWTICAAPLVPV